MVKRTRAVADAENVHLKSTRPSRNQNERQKRAKKLDQSKFNDEDAKQASGRQHDTQESHLQKNRDTSESKESNTNVKNESRPSELPSTKMAVVEKVGDLFDAPDEAVLIHACNCIGSWGAGIAAAFKTRYPEAFIEYRQHCRSNKIENLNGSALLIPPLEEDGPKHFVGCLFTSKRPGKARDSPEDILQNTETALFNVPWESTKSLIEKLDFKDENVPRTISAWVPASEP
jgi:ADP-ribose 1''-phosphate phosphatase